MNVVKQSIDLEQYQVEISIEKKDAIGDSIKEKPSKQKRHGRAPELQELLREDKLIIKKSVDNYVIYWRIGLGLSEKEVRRLGREVMKKLLSIKS